MRSADGALRKLFLVGAKLDRLFRLWPAARKKELGGGFHKCILSLALSPLLRLSLSGHDYLLPARSLGPLPFVDSLAVTPLSLVAQLHIRRVGLLEWVTVNEPEGGGGPG